MSKEFTGVTAESSHYCNTKITLAFVPRLILPKPNKFNELYDDDSTFRVMMQEGKGESAPKIRYNLTVDEFVYLAEGFMNKNLSLPVYLPKAIQSKIPDGEFAGMYYTSEFKLEFIQGNRYPWKINLRCGYSKEKGKMEVEKKQISAFLTESEVFKHFWKGMQAIKAFIEIFAYPQIKEGYAQLAELQKGNYDLSADRYTLQAENSTGSHNGENNIIPNQVYNAPMEAVQQPQQQQPQMQQMKLTVISQPIAVDGCIVCQILIAGNKYNLYCQQFTQELNDSLQNQTIIEANLFEYNNLLCYGGLYIR